ncbi:MAG: hypothetical protein Q7R95_09150 [bacterium]|nr:hypothetical protein [bacterium]
MKKETIAAIVFGIILGSVVGIFLITKNKEKQLDKNKAIVTVNTTTQTSKAASVNTQTLEITVPADKAIVYQNSITIKGNVAKNSLIVIQSPIKDVVFKSDTNQISIDFPLALGENVIRISSYPQDKQLRSQEKEIRIYYFNEKL